MWNSNIGDWGEGNDYVTNLLKPRVKLQIEEKSVTRRDDHVQGGFRKCRKGKKTNSSVRSSGHVTSQQAMPILASDRMRDYSNSLGRRGGRILRTFVAPSVDLSHCALSVSEEMVIFPLTNDKIRDYHFFFIIQI